jgi:ribulose kinase
MCAAVAAGLHDNLSACAARVGDIVATMTPDPARRAAYDEAYGAYHRLFGSLRPMFENQTG